jgi:prepilin-type N-terminal cleavage/methylation domain-containing protein
MERTQVSERGFTLIELLVSMVLLSIVLGAVYSTFFLAHKALDGMDESILKLRECRMFMDTIVRETDSILAGQKYSAFKVEDRDIFGKETSRFTFTAFSPLVPGLSLISYYVDQKDGKLVLFKKLWSVSSTVQGEPVELMEGIRSFTVEVRNGDKWVKTWDFTETRRVPDEIRITLTVMIKDRPVSLYETVSPKIGRIL